MDGKLSNMFLINAPAGSGKTTYIENRIIDLLAKFPNRRILSITYTNRAKNELRSRVNSENVTIDTIHSFLSKYINRYLSKTEVLDLFFEIFQSQIEQSLSKGEQDGKNARYIEKYGTLDIQTLSQNIRTIYYNEQPFSNYYYGGLSHDDILFFSRELFAKFPILKRRLSNTYAYVFIDEYQDTSADVLHLFFDALKNTSSQLYLLGDKMQEIYDNYDGSFDDKLERFDGSYSLNINYRCSNSIVTCLNGLYNDKEFDQTANFCVDKKPTILLCDFESNDVVDRFQDHMKLYVFNRTRFEKVGSKQLYEAVNAMEAYKFPSRHSVVDVLTTKTGDNPDSLFRLLFILLDFLDLADKKRYGRTIQLAKSKSQIFHENLTNIQYHQDKVIFMEKVDQLRKQCASSTLLIGGLCKFLFEHEYCNIAVFEPFFENQEYEGVLNTPVAELFSLYSYLNKPTISTQHGVKGEGHDYVCFIAEDSLRSPQVRIYDFFRLFCTEDINLTDFQRFYYDYANWIDSAKKAEEFASAAEYEKHRDKYLGLATEIYDLYRDNKYFMFSEAKYYRTYLDKKHFTSAKECFKATRVKGILWAYKLFYVGCSRAKRDLVVLVDRKKVSDFEKEFKTKMGSIGFEISG